MRRAVVIGAGIGGLSAAIALAADGWCVTVVEAMPRAGGKAGVVELDGVEVDTGPSVLTLPDAFDAVLRRAGTSLAEQVQLRAVSPGFRYLWPDGACVDVHHALDDTVASVGASLGRQAGTELQRFLARARRTWEAAAPHFVMGPAPGLASLARPGALAALLHLDPLRTMLGAIEADVRDPHLRDLLMRYATYNGSDVRRAPATLNCIAHVELALGGWGVEGGLHALVRALLRACERLGVNVRLSTPARAILREQGRVTGVDLDAEVLPANVVVCNADVGALGALLPAHEGRLPPSLRPSETPSTSGWTGILRARRGAAASPHARPRVPHTVLFPPVYDDEFADLFDAGRAPRAPTAYLCAQEAAHGRTGWPDAEPVFVMANAPAVQEGSPPDEDAETSLRDRTLARLDASGLRAPDDVLLWERSPRGLAAEHPGSRGALYGAASNDAFAAFRRPANRTAVRGLYLASGSAHPGGGIPLCARSGLAAAACVAEDMP